MQVTRAEFVEDAAGLTGQGGTRGRARRGRLRRAPPAPVPQHASDSTDRRPGKGPAGWTDSGREAAKADDSKELP